MLHNSLIKSRRPSAFTLIELLIVVTIVAILSAVAVVNFRLAADRSYKAADAANLKVIATALQTYFVDNGRLPPADHEAGPFPSHSSSFHDVGNAPAAGGSWDAVPWLLLEQGYLSDWKVLFCPKYIKLYGGGQTIRGGWPRYHNFRYAYNAAGLGAGGYSGGAGNVNSGEVWIVRDLYLSPGAGFYGASAPRYPADYHYPWGEGDNENKLEHVLFADMAVRTVYGGESTGPGTNF